MFNIKAFFSLWCVVGFIVSAFASADGYSYSYNTCNGSPVTLSGTSSPVTILHGCFSGYPSTSDISYSINEWNNVHGVNHSFSPVTYSYPATCSPGLGNNTNEIYYKPSSQMDGNAGIIWLTHNSSCFWSWSTKSITEFDIAIADDLPKGNPSCDSEPLGAGNRTTILHELGHAMGLEHENYAMSLMMRSNGEGVYCGPHSAVPHPDDSQGARFLYSFPYDVISSDLAASEFMYAGFDQVELNNPKTDYIRCPGSNLLFKYSVANLGTVQETYNIRWYFSSTPDELGTPIGTNWGGRISPGKFYTYERAVTIPYPDSIEGYGQTYYIHSFIDFDNQIDERYEDNNFTYLATRVSVPGYFVCHPPTFP